MNIYEEYVRARDEYLKIVDEYERAWNKLTLLEKIEKQEKQLQDIINIKIKKIWK